jgi:predicted metal-dependent hydrolase
MTDYVDLGGHRVEIRRHATARHVRLSVDPRVGGFRLTVPKRAALTPALQWARGQVDWVARKATDIPTVCPIISGMQIPFGDGYLIVDWRTAYPRIPRRVFDTLQVGGAESDLSARVIRWLKRAALRQLTIDTREIAGRGGLDVGRIGVGDPRSRWGSCSAKGDIRYSWRLIMAPVHVRLATVAHEVAHLRHMNHGAEFHQLVEQLHDGDVSAARAWLRAEGSTLHRIGQA